MNDKKHIAKLIVPLVVLGLIIMALVYWMVRPPKLAFSTVKVTRGQLMETFTASGKVEASQNADLSFERAGKITQIKVAVGDKVKAGQILVTEQNDDVAAQLAQAQAALDKQLAGSTPEYLAQLQAAVDKAKADLANVSGVTPGVDDSKLVRDAYDNLFASLLSVQTILQSGTNSVGSILGIDGALLNNPYNNVISALDTAGLETTKNQYYQTKSLKVQFDTHLNQLNSDSNHLEIDSAATQGIQALEQLKQLLFLTANCLEKTVAMGGLSQTNLDTMKNSIQQVRVSVNSQYTSLISNVHAIDTAKNAFFSYQALLDKSLAALQDAKNPPRSVDVAVTQASVNLALANYNKTILRAPFDGVVSRLDAKLGQTISAGVVQASLISDKAYQISVYLPETAIAKVVAGQAAEITLDNIGAANVFSAKVTSVSLSPENIGSGVLGYKVVLQFDEENPSIKPGLTANVKIITAQKDGVLTVEGRDVVQKDGQYYVTIQDEKGKFVSRQITVGLGNSQSQWEVLSGLSENDMVVTYGQNNN